MLLAEAIKRNRIKQARYRRAEKVLRAVRQRVFDYEDQGKYDKARKVMETCHRILAPLRRLERSKMLDRKLQNSPTAFEPGGSEIGREPRQSDYN